MNLREAYLNLYVCLSLTNAFFPKLESSAVFPPGVNIVAQVRWAGGGAQRVRFAC
jgi:hypothetical protein